MKWTLAHRQSTVFREFHLVEGNSTREKLQYDPVRQSARIGSRGKQRLFFLEPGGFWGHDITFTSEYGLKIGKLTIHKKYASGGTLLIENRKFHYAVKEDELVTLAIFEKGNDHPLITCNFEAQQNGTGPGMSPLDDAIHQYACLLLGLGWYLFMPGSAEMEIPAESPRELTSSFPSPDKKEFVS